MTPLHLSNPINHAYQLGASLYMPATRNDLWQVISREKLVDIDSIIICLEDAVNESDIDLALQNTQKLLIALQENINNLSSQRPFVFIRPRHANMLQQMADWQGLAYIQGFVLPKVDLTTLASWQRACENLSKHHVLMPTLETKAIFNPTHNDALADILADSFDQQILALRIGGNDLMACLRIRRPPDVTIYETPIGTLIYQLLGCFVPQGFYLTAPVFEFLDKPELFAKELQQDINIGLVGKTIIHPKQANIVKQALQVDKQMLSQAQAILAPNAKAVFQQDKTMLEPATHRAWAEMIMARYHLFKSR